MRVVLDRYKIIADIVHGKTVLDVGCVDHDLDNRKRSRWLHQVLCDSAAHVVGLDYHAPSVRQF